MAWTFHPIGSWTEATTTSPATEMAAAMALPQSYRWHVHGVTALIRNDQVATLAGPTGPPAGYVAWYDASQITGQADNTALTTWPDLSPNAYNLTGAGGRPTYYSSTPGKTINGKPAVFFSGAASFMQTAALVPAPGTLFVVADLSAVSGYQALIASGNGGIELRVTPTGKLDALKQGNVDLATSTGSVPGVTPFMAGMTYDGAQVVFYINSGTPDSTVTGLSAVLTPQAFSPNFQSDQLTGSFAEIVWYSSVLTAPQIAATYGYLKAKWGTP